VTWDDADKTPATGVYIEAHSFDVNYVSEKSFVLKMVKAGRYEAALPLGVYDVFVSEASSIPRCRRVLVAGHTPYWNIMLEHDDVYLQR
jgi:cytidine deaminase